MRYQLPLPLFTLASFGHHTKECIPITQIKNDCVWVRGLLEALCIYYRITSRDKLPGIYGNVNYFSSEQEDEVKMDKTGLLCWH